MLNRNTAILIVEDDPDTRETMKLALETENYEVVMAINGQNALDVLNAGANVSLILLDMMMPQMNGREFLDAVALDQHLSAIPVIIVAADLAENMRMGSVGYLPKPTDLDTLLSMVERFKLKNG